MRHEMTGSRQYLTLTRYEALALLVELADVFQRALAHDHFLYGADVVEDCIARYGHRWA